MDDDSDDESDESSDIGKPLALKYPTFSLN